MQLSFRWKKKILKQILLSELWCLGQVYTIPKFMKKEIEKAIQNFLLDKGIYELTDTAQLFIWRCGKITLIMCKATVQSHKFWRHSWWLTFVCLFVCVFVCFLFVPSCYFVCFYFVFIFNFFFSRILGMGVEALIRKILGFLGGAGHYNLCWPV